MPRPAGRLLRDNAFIVAAVLLPLAVVGFFLLSTAVPRWTVPPPAYDLVVKAGSYTSPPPQVMVDYYVSGDRVHAHVRPVPPNGYPQRSALFLFEHATGQLREIHVDLPRAMGPDDEPRNISVTALADRRVMTAPRAPDGYELEQRTHRGPGIIGDLFGMRRYDQGVVLVSRGRVVPVTLPAPHQYLSPVSALGWIVPEGAR